LSYIQKYKGAAGKGIKPSSPYVGPIRGRVPSGTIPLIPHKGKSEYLVGLIVAGERFELPTSWV